MRTLYGPVDSWRFGRSLGIDPLAQRHKVCPFSCTYCQYGPTPDPITRRRVWVSAEQLRADLNALGPVAADCVTVAGYGEPTLAANLPALVRAVRDHLELPVIVLTGSALLPQGGVRQDLLCFDTIVATLNAADEKTFAQINHPTQGYPYSFSAIVDGLRHLRQNYSGRLVLHVMLVQANVETAPQLAALARTLSPDEVQLNTPCQPALGEPLSQPELLHAAHSFAELTLRTVYDEDIHLSPRMI